MSVLKDIGSLKMFILHTTNKFAFNEFLRLKLLDYINGTDTASDNMFNSRHNLNELDTETIDYFIGSYEKFRKLLNIHDISDDQLYEIFNNRYAIIKS